MAADSIVTVDAKGNITRRVMLPSVTSDTNANDLTLSSASYATTGLAVTFTAVASELVLCHFVGTITDSTVATQITLGYKIDSGSVVDIHGVIEVGENKSLASVAFPISGLSAASHTIELYYKKTAGNNGTLFGTTSGYDCSFYVVRFVV